MKSSTLAFAVVFAAVTLSAPSARGQQPAQAATEEVGARDSAVPLTLQAARRNRFNRDLATVTFRHFDSLFHTHAVVKGTKRWELPVETRPLPSGYTFEGTTRSIEEGLERSRTNALLVIRSGRIVHEDYRNLSRPEDRFISFSMAKSITSLILGKALAAGLIGSLDDPVTRYVPELKGSGYDGATLRDLLQMRSGADWQERYDYLDKPSRAAQVSNDVFVMEKYHMADAARELASAHKPGAVFNYSSLDTAVLGEVIARATGRNFTDLTREWLWSPLGTDADALWLMDGPDGTGQEVVAMGYNARLRDYGRLGLMVLNNGRANGHQIIPADWVHQSTRPYSGAGRPLDGPLDYGFQWWTLKDSSAFMAIGFAGQYIYVDPAHETVVVKLSFDLDDSRKRPETLALLKALAEAPYNSTLPLRTPKP